MDGEGECGAVGGRKLNEKALSAWQSTVLGALALSIPSKRSCSLTISSHIYSTFHHFNHYVLTSLTETLVFGVALVMEWGWE